MRMGKAADRTAADIVNNYEADDLQQVFGEYGEVRNARSLAHAIVEAREKAPIVTIQNFLDVCDPWVRGTRPRYLAQVFQALRIEVNDEIGALTDLLAQATDLPTRWKTASRKTSSKPATQTETSSRIFTGKLTVPIKS